MPLHYSCSMFTTLMRGTEAARGQLVEAEEEELALQAVEFNLRLRVVSLDGLYTVLLVCKSSSLLR
jgi:hypothetical protein